MAMTPRKPTFWRILRVGIIILCCLLFALTIAPRLFQRPVCQFDAEKWRAANPKKGDHRTVRSEMIHDLLARYNFVGWSSADILALLGNPDDGWSGFPQWEMVYVLGLERGGNYALDDEALGFKFDQCGHVVEYGLSVN